MWAWIFFIMGMSVLGAGFYTAIVLWDNYRYGWMDYAGARSTNPCKKKT